MGFAQLQNLPAKHQNISLHPSKLTLASLKNVFFSHQQVHELSKQNNSTLGKCHELKDSIVHNSFH
jgi:hypothetical protein